MAKAEKVTDAMFVAASQASGNRIITMLQLQGAWSSAA
jgi:hypothetical protein